MFDCINGFDCDLIITGTALGKHDGIASPSPAVPFAGKRRYRNSSHRGRRQQFPTRSSRKRSSNSVVWSLCSVICCCQLGGQTDCKTEDDFELKGGFLKIAGPFTVVFTGTSYLLKN